MLNGGTTTSRGKAGAGVVAAIAILAAVVLLPSARADDVMAEAGARIAAHGTAPGRAACSACHGQNGAGQPEVGIPRLAGLTADYIDDQLRYFASGERPNYVMSSYAAALTEAERRQVADYYAGFPVPSLPDPAAAQDEALGRGRVIFLNGEPSKGLLACSQCHGPDGLGVGGFSPRLAGQSAPYILEQLQAWHGGTERDPKGQFMRAIASRLDPDDMRAVADYAASLAPKSGGTP